MSRRALIFTILAAVVVAGLAWVLIVMPYRAQRQWDAAKAALVARGEKMSLADFPPSKVRDEENFFADSIWRELSERERMEASTSVPLVPAEKWQIRVLRLPFEKAELQGLRADFPEFKPLAMAQPVSAIDDRLTVLWKIWEQADKDPGQFRRAAEVTFRVLAGGEPIIERLRELAQRQGAWFPMEYSDGLGLQYEHATYLRAAGRWLAFRGSALLETGDYRAAYQDAVLIFRLAETLGSNELFIPTRAEASLVDLFSGLIDEGIRIHAWTADDLRVFDQMLAKVDAPQRLANALRMERAFMLDVVWPNLSRGDLKVIVPEDGPMSPVLLWTYRTFWMPGDKTLYCDVIQREAESLDAVPRQGMNPRFFPDHIRNYLTANPSLVGKFSRAVTMLTLPSQAGTVIWAAKTQTAVLLTRAAIALELYRMQHGEYPESLAVLNPGKPGSIPLDLITGEPFRYKRNDDGSFAMWSVGWNEKDENGLIARKVTEGDWAWGD